MLAALLMEPAHVAGRTWHLVPVMTRDQVHALLCMRRPTLSCTLIETGVKVLSCTAPTSPVMDVLVSLLVPVSNGLW